MSLFVVRLFSAVTLYMLLSKANVYFSELEQSILVGGYRFLLVFSPLLVYFFSNALFAGFLLAALSLAALYFDSGLIVISLLTLGLSSGGYLIKKQAAESSQGAAFNKLALSFGSIVAGVLLFILPDSRLVFFAFAVALLLLACCIVYFQADDGAQDSQPLSYRTSGVSGFAWVFCGVGIGIRVFGLFVILPQYLISQLGDLPPWYGLVISSYSALVIVSQVPALSSKKTPSFTVSLSALFASCLILAVPQGFGAEYLLGSLIWCLLLVLEETFAPYIDVEASKNGSLLYKEVGVGLGGALSVWLMRSYQCPLATGLTGCVAIAIFFVLYRRGERREKSQLA